MKMVKRIVWGLLLAALIVSVIVPLAANAEYTVEQESVYFDNHDKESHSNARCYNAILYSYPSEASEVRQSQFTASVTNYSIGQNRSGEYWCRVNGGGTTGYVRADYVTPLYGEAYFYTDIYDANNQNILQYTDEGCFTKSYKLNGIIYNGGYQTSTIDSVDVVIQGDKTVTGSVNLGTNGNYHVTQDSALSSKLDFSKLTVGQSYHMTVTTQYTDHNYPVSKSSVTDYSFSKVWETDFTLQKGDEEQVTVGVSNVRAPSGTLEYGKKYTLKGAITATGAKLSQVGARVYAASDTSLSQPLTGTTVNVNTSSYSIEGSTLDTSCKFATLEPGSYVYVISSKAGGKSFNEVYRSTFKISTPYYTVTYDGNGYWTGIPDDQTKQYNVNLKLSSAAPTRENYEFLGWATSKTATTATYQPGDPYKANKNVTLYAVWNKTTTTIKLYPNDYYMTNEIISIPTGSSYQFAKDDYERGSLIFMGWRQGETTWDGSGVEYYVGDVYNSEDDVTLYGVWKPKEYMISFDANGGTGAPEPISRFSNQTSITLPNDIPDKPGFVFDGWEDRSYNGVVYQAGQTLSSETSPVVYSRNVTLYAIWREEGTAKLTTHILYAHSDTMSPNYTVYGFTTSQMETLRQDSNYYGFDEIIVTRTTNMLGKTIRELGWEDVMNVDDSDFWYYAMNDGQYMPARIQSWRTGEDFTGEEVTANTVITGDLDIYPSYWRQYTISFDANGGVGGPGEVREYAVNSIVGFAKYCKPEIAPTMDGCEFLGWSEDDQATEPMYKYGDRFTRDEWYEMYGHNNLTFYAVWGGAYSVTIGNEKTYYPGGNFIVPDIVPTKTFVPDFGDTVEYTFLGWSTSPDATVPEYLNGQSYQIHDNITLYPVWGEDFACLRMLMYQGSNCAYPYRPSYATGKHALRVTAFWVSFAASEPGKTIEEYGWTLYDETNFHVEEGTRITGWYAGETGTDERITMRTRINGTVYIHSTYSYGTSADCPDFRTGYSVNGGLGTPEPEYTNAGESFIVTSVIPSRFDYEFLGWASSADAMEPEYQAGDTFTATEDSTLYAVWQYNPHTHETVLQNAKEQSCTEEGYTGDLVCTVCGETIQQGAVIPTHTRKTTVDTISEKTCTEDGYFEEVVICTVCGEELSRESKIEPATGHQPAEPVKENLVEVTESSSGSYDEVVYCELCQEELSREHLVIPRVIVFAHREIQLPIGLDSSFELALLDYDTGETVKHLETYSWNSSDESVATVDELGCVAAVSEGSAVITVIAENGFTSSCTVTVCAIPENKLQIPSGTVSVEDEAFQNTAVEYVVIPASTVTIGAEAFAYNNALSMVEFLSGDVQIDATAFTGCGNLIVIAPEGGTVEDWAKENQFFFVAD